MCKDKKQKTSQMVIFIPSCMIYSVSDLCVTYIKKRGLSTSGCPVVKRNFNVQHDKNIFFLQGCDVKELYINNGLHYNIMQGLMLNPPRTHTHMQNADWKCLQCCLTSFSFFIKHMRLQTHPFPDSRTETHFMASFSQVWYMFWQAGRLWTIMSVTQNKVFKP